MNTHLSNGEGWKMLRAMYSERSTALEMGVRPNSNGKMFYTPEQFAESKVVKKLDGHVRMAEAIVEFKGAAGESPEINALCRYWKTIEAIDLQEKQGAKNVSKQKFRI